MDPPVRLDWDGLPIPPDPKEIYAIHDWSAVEEAVRFYAPNNVELAVHPDASLRFANEFVKELKSGQGAEEGYLVINPEIAYCKAEMFHSLLPHVKALGDWAISIGSEIKKVGAVVREMTSRYNDACERNIFPLPGPDAQVHEPLAETERVYMQVTSKRGLDLVAAPFRKHMATLPQRCTSLAEMASAQPSEEAVQTELYKMNLQFLQEKLKLLGSFEEQVKKIHANMDELLLGSTSLGSAKTVVDFVDVNLMSGKLFKTKTDDGEINTGDDGEFVAGSFFKCLCFLDLWLSLQILAGLGGEGDKRSGARLWECGGFPGDEEDASSECEVLALPGAPWWRSAPSGTKRRLLPFSVCWWWRWFALVVSLWPAVEARGVAAWSSGVWLAGLGTAASAGRWWLLESWCFGRVRSASTDSVAARRMDYAAIYNVGWRLLSGGERYDDAGNG